MMITDKINFKQPKYVLPAILYPLLLISGYLIFDIFDTEPAETGNTLQTTEFLNPELPRHVWITTEASTANMRAW